jgi:hypothetical protein
VQIWYVEVGEHETKPNNNHTPYQIVVLL